jgi:transcriptional regulator with XRE-family HTH domain
VAIGERLREERKRLKMTQAVFAQVGGIGVSALKMYEGNEREPGALFLAAIANAGADVQYIVTGTPSASAVSADEQVLLDGYRALDPATRRRMLAFMLGGDAASEKNSPPSITVTASGHGTQAAGRKIVNRGKQ